MQNDCISISLLVIKFCMKNMGVDATDVQHDMKGAAIKTINIFMYLSMVTTWSLIITADNIIGELFEI